MRNYFVFDGVDSRSFGVYISGQGTFKSPARIYDEIQIPGKNGNLLGLENRLENVDLTYPAFIYSNFDANISNLRSFLLSKTGYFELKDSYHPAEYRMAYFPGPLEPDVTSRNNAGSFDLTFLCKPQRFLESGKTIQVFTEDGIIQNPSYFASLPLLRVYGTGTVSIGEHTITITQADEYTDIDCEMMDAYKGTVNKNQYIRLSGNDFPALEPGENGIAIDGVTRIEITPRWWIA